MGGRDGLQGMSCELDQVLELMAIPGETAREGAVAMRVRELLLDMGIPASCVCHDEAHRRSSYGGEVGNLIVRLEGHGRGLPRMLSTHLDTVTDAVGCRPRLSGDRVVNDAPCGSLGADARAGVAVLLAAARALSARRGDHPPCVLLFLIQEEVGLVGSKLLDTSQLGVPLPAIAFNFDGETVEEIENEIVGTERLFIDLAGVGVHTARPNEGISCAVILAEALSRLVREGWHGVIDREGGWATANLGAIRGGANSNVTMPALNALAECRSFDLVFRTRVLNVWRNAFEQAVAHANDLAEARGVKRRAAVTFTPGPEYPPCFLPASSTVVRTACEAIRRLGRNPRLLRDAGGQDTCNLVAKGIPTVGLGVGMRHAHAADEFLDLPDFFAACRLAADLATMDAVL